MKIYYILGILSLFILAACAPQPESIGGGTPVRAETPAPGVDPGSVQETVVVVTGSNPYIATSDQAIIEDSIYVDNLFLDKPGYIVVHKVVDGKPGDVIGNSDLLEGELVQVFVLISDYEGENELIAMLHYDDGDGIYVFPGDDNPTTVDGELILQKFTLLTEEVTTTGSQVKEIEVTAKRWEFTPNPIEVSLGDRVRLKVTSIDVSHGFALPEFGISQRLNPGNTATAEFTADKAGSFTFLCNVPCGRGHSGMRGTLIVS